MNRLTLLSLFLASTVSLLAGCSEKQPTSVTDGIAPSALEQYQANEKKLNEETAKSVKEEETE